MTAAMLRAFFVVLASIALIGIGAPCAAAQPAPAHAAVLSMSQDCPDTTPAAPDHHEGAPAVVCTFTCGAVMPAPVPAASPLRVSYPAEFSTAAKPLAGLEPAPQTPPPRGHAP